ncbi:MAG: methionine adenosyltransferase [Actinobacteria bacterium]|nr:methionine adenosyltransferase [Actinomycetota bacterium]MBU4301504.1 methionine adenosyltransferase [Actinomycetota bacterium]MBU4489417.1 methionine adenosyltransferase [Actinomycetota bacterium]MCG2796059.1 methionine adenosyltransferase [Actinomycetes bacterium]
MPQEKNLLTSESVTEGHPDKVSDQISDAILDSIIKDDPRARVACETLVTTGLVIVSGEITTDTYVEIPSVVRETVEGIGYTRAKFGFDYETCAVLTSIDPQSPDIAMGVNHSAEARSEISDDELDEMGAGDQGMMFGFACKETEELMPLPIMLAHKLALRLADVRKADVLPYLRPDGKTQVTVEYEKYKPVRVRTIVIAAQHSPDVDIKNLLTPDLKDHVITPIVPPELIDDRTKIIVNRTGKFVLGGPKADTGLTGRKIIVDTYGGAARHGGGCFSGKDPSKVDRSASYAARYIAKNVVAAGLAERFEVQLAYVIGRAHPVSVNCEAFGTENVSIDKITELIHEHFDLRPAAIIRDLKLLKPIYKKTAAYGHFGRMEEGFTWEKTDKADVLRSDAGL